VEKALAEGEALLLNRIVQASDTQWQAAAWMLERTRPDRSARREKLEHSGKLTQRVEQDVPDSVEVGEELRRRREEFPARSDGS
jgi:hypothetical protein